MSDPRPAPRALLVEHDEGLRRTLTLALETLGFHVDAVASGEAAVDALAGRVVTIAIVDARLPGALSGLEVLEALQLALASLPVILLAEPDRARDLIAAFHAGAADVLLKPFEIAELRACLGRVLAHAQGGGAAGEAAVDFHGRVELAKTALGVGALEVADAHLRAALALDPLDAEVLNLYGLCVELGGDLERATRAYRTAFAAHPQYGRARRNLERASDQSAFLGAVTGERHPEPPDPLDGVRLRLVLPLLDPPRDLSLLRVAKLIGGSACGVVVGVLLDPPTEEDAAARVVAERPAFVRATGRNDTRTIPAAVRYLFARDALAGARALVAGDPAALVLVGEWAPAPLVVALRQAGCAVLVARTSEVPASPCVSCDLEGARAAEMLALALHLAAATRAQLLLPDALVGEGEVAALAAAALCERARLVPPAWLDGEVHVSARRRTPADVPLHVGREEDSFIQCLF